MFNIYVQNVSLLLGNSGTDKWRGGGGGSVLWGFIGGGDPCHQPKETQKDPRTASGSNHFHPKGLAAQSPFQLYHSKILPRARRTDYLFLKKTLIFYPITTFLWIQIDMCDTVRPPLIRISPFLISNVKSSSSCCIFIFAVTTSSSPHSSFSNLLGWRPRSRNRA